MAAEGCDQRFVFGVFFVTFLNAAQVSTEPNFNEKEVFTTGAHSLRQTFVGGGLEKSGMLLA